MRLTKKRVKELHTELWLWLAENPEKEKGYWLRWEENGGDIPYVAAYCFACEYSERHKKERGYCLLDFPGWEQNTTCTIESCLGGLFEGWACTRGEARSALAKQIAELPIRKRR